MNNIDPESARISRWQLDGYMAGRWLASAILAKRDSFSLEGLEKALLEDPGNCLAIEHTECGARIGGFQEIIDGIMQSWLAFRDGNMFLRRASPCDLLAINLMREAENPEFFSWAARIAARVSN